MPDCVSTEFFLNLIILFKEKRMTMKFIYFTLGLLVLTFAGTWDGSTLKLSNVSLYLNIPSLLIVLGGTSLLSLANHSLRSILVAYYDALTNKILTVRESKNHLNVLSSIHHLSLGTGVFGVLVGLTLSLVNLSDPKAIGPAIAITYLSLLYSLIVSEIITRPLMSRVRANQVPFDEATPPESSLTIFGFALGIAMVSFMGFAVILLAFGNA